MVKPLTYGRMGNFLFQVACAIGYATKHGLDFTVPNETTSKVWNPLYLQHLVNPEWSDLYEQIRITESGHAYQELPFQEDWRNKNIILDGYWQSEKYFKEYRWQVLAFFGFPYERKPNTVSVHVRRGDYLELPEKHPPMTIEWIASAMMLFPGKKFLFHSDDLQWCRDNFSHINDCYFSEGTNEVEDLISMSCCVHNICSASTMSWWGMWLNRNQQKTVVFPKQWFVPGYCDLNTDDIIPEWCIKY